MAYNFLGHVYTCVQQNETTNSWEIKPGIYNQLILNISGIALFFATGMAVGFLRASRKHLRKISELRKMLKRIAEEI